MRIEEILVEYPQLTEEDVRAAIAYGREKRMRKLTPEEKQQLQAMFDKQSKEQGKKRRDYRKYKAKLRTAERLSRSAPRRSPPPQTPRYHMDVGQRLEYLEGKQLRATKHSKLRRMQLTEREKRELKNKIYRNK